MLQFQLQAWCPIPFVPEEDLVPIMGVKIMVACRTIVPGTGLAALGAALAAATPALAQEVAPEDDSIVVTAQRENETQVKIGRAQYELQSLLRISYAVLC